MKAGRAHRVPLCDRAVEMLNRMHEPRRRSDEDALIFEGRPGRPTSDMTMTQTLRWARPALTLLCFRSSLRACGPERPRYPHELAEPAITLHLQSTSHVALLRR